MVRRVLYTQPAATPAMTPAPQIVNCVPTPAGPSIHTSSAAAEPARAPQALGGERAAGGLGARVGQRRVRAGDGDGGARVHVGVADSRGTGASAIAHSATSGVTSAAASAAKAALKRTNRQKGRPATPSKPRATKASGASSAMHATPSATPRRAVVRGSQPSTG